MHERARVEKKRKYWEPGVGGAETLTRTSRQLWIFCGQSLTPVGSKCLTRRFVRGTLSIFDAIRSLMFIRSEMSVGPVVDFPPCDTAPGSPDRPCAPAIIMRGPLRARLVLTAVTVSRYDRTPSCGGSNTDLQHSLSGHSCRDSRQTRNPPGRVSLRLIKETNPARTNAPPSHRTSAKRSMPVS